VRVGDVFKSAGAPGINIFAIKASFWIAR
jgi:hypothetical protein